MPKKLIKAIDIKPVIMKAIPAPCNGFGILL